MIEYNLDTEHSDLDVQRKSAIEQDDFVKLAKAVDPTSRQAAVWLVSSSKPRRSPDGRVLGPWSTSFASFAIITSASGESQS